MLGRATDSETAKFSSYTHCLLQVSVLKRGDSGPAALNSRGLGKVLPFLWGGGRQGNWGEAAASVAVALFKVTFTRW